MSASSHPMQTRSKTSLTFDLTVPTVVKKDTPSEDPTWTFSTTSGTLELRPAVTFIRVVAEAQRQGVPVEHLVTWFSDEEVPYRSELLLYGAIQTVADTLGVDALDVYTACRDAIQATE